MMPDPPDVMQDCAPRASRSRRFSPHERKHMVRREPLKLGGRKAGEQEGREAGRQGNREAGKQLGRPQEQKV